MHVTDAAGGPRLLPEIADYLARHPRPSLRDMQGAAPPVRRAVNLRLHGAAGPLAARLYVPLAPCRAPLPVILFLHGGGWSRGDVALYDTPCRALAQASRCAVVFIDYRLLPAHPFPAALMDARAALADLAARCGEWGCDPARIAVAGDSAGGNLAAALCLLARDEGGPAIRHQVLIYPPLDATMASPSLGANRDDPMLSADGIAAVYAQYAASAAPRHAWLSPLHADTLAGLPGATLFAAGLDPLRDDALRYAARLNASGVAAACIDLAGVPHMGIHMRGISPACARIYAVAGEHLRAALAGE